MKLLSMIALSNLGIQIDYHGAKEWIKSTNFFDKENWKDQKLPCESDRIIFPKAVPLVALGSSVKVSEMVRIGMVGILLC